jgi:hypothetical protein
MANDFLSQLRDADLTRATQGAANAATAVTGLRSTTADIGRTYSISRELGLPPSVIAANPDRFEQEATRRRDQRALSNAPGTSAFLLQNPNIGLSSEDAQQLAAVETILRRDPQQEGDNPLVDQFTDLRNRGFTGVLGRLFSTPLDALGTPEFDPTRRSEMAQERLQGNLSTLTELAGILGAAVGPEEAQRMLAEVLAEFDASIGEGQAPLTGEGPILDALTQAMEELDLGLVGEGLSPTADTQRQALEAQLELETDPERIAVLEEEIERLSPGQSVLQDIVAALPELSSALASTTGDAPEPIYGPGRQFLVEATRSLARMPIDILEYGDLAQAMLRATVSGEPYEFEDYRTATDFTAVLRYGLGEMLPVDEARQEDFATNLASGAGSLLGFYALGAARIPVWLAGAATSGVSMYEDAGAHYATAGQRYWSIIAGSGIGLTEAVPIDRALRRVSAGVGDDVFAALLRNTEAATVEEFSQELIQAFGEDVISSYIVPYNPDGLQPRDWFEQAIIGGITGFGAGAATTGGSAVVQALRPQVDPRQQFMDDVTTAMQEARLGQQAPDMMARALDQIAPDQELYVSPENLDQLFQSGEATLQDFGFTQEQFDDARASGTALPIPMSRYGSQMVNTPIGDWVRQNSAMSAEQLSVSEMQALLEQRGEDGVDPAMARVEAELSRVVSNFEDAQLIFDNVYQQLRQTGATPQVAQRQAEAQQAFWRTLADKTDGQYGTASEMAQRFGGILRIERTQAPTVQRDAENTELQQAAATVRRTPEFDTWFGDSVVRDENDEPMVVYHGTSADFESFKVLSHFGTQRAADDRIVGSRESRLPTDGENTIPVYLSISNPLQLGPERSMGGDWWDTDNDMFRQVVGELRRSGREQLANDVEDLLLAGPGDAELTRVGTPVAHERIVELLEEAGYDGLTYVNGYEDAGATSYVAFRPEQIKSVFNERPTSDPRLLFQPGLQHFDNPLPIDGKVTVKKIGEAFTEAHMETYGRKLFPEDSEADYQEVLRVASEELAEQMSRPNSGHGWYSKDVELAIQQTDRLLEGVDTPEGRAVYLTFAGIFSNGLDPSQAWEIAAEAYQAWRISGEIPINRADAARARGEDPVMTSYKDRTTGKQVTKEAGWGIRNPANEQQLQMFRTLVEQKGGVLEALDWMVNPQPRADINQLMADAGVKTPRYKTKAERAGPPAFGAMIFSEKLGRYTLGLHGVPLGSEDTTVDLWYTRTYRRLTGRLLDKPIGKEGVAAQPDPARGGIERKTIFRLTEDLRQQYDNLTAGDVQAMLWFFEKRLWGAQGLRTDEGTNSAGARRLLGKAGLDFDDRSGGRRADAQDSAQSAQATRTDDGGDAGGGDTGADARDGRPLQQSGRGEGSSRTVSPEEFNAAMEAAGPALGMMAAQVSTVDPARDVTRVLLDDGATGYALDGDNLIGVFSTPGASPMGAGLRIMRDAVQRGARRLDGFDTFLPKLYAAGGFRAVARLPFDPQYAPARPDALGDWDAEAMEAHRAGWGSPDVVFMVYDPSNASAETDNVVADYDDGVAAQDAALSQLGPVALLPEDADPFALREPGQLVERARGSPEAASALDEQLRTAQQFTSIDELFERAAPAHDLLTQTIGEIAEELGAFQRVATLKSRERTQAKVERKYAGNPNRMTDVARGGIEADTLQQADEFVRLLAQRFSVIDEGFNVTGAGYFDRKLTVVMPDGVLAEVQIWPPGMYDAKEERGGHDLYVEYQADTTTPDRRAFLQQSMAQLYLGVAAQLDSSWLGILPPSVATAAENLASSTSGDRSSLSTSEGSMGSQEAPPDASNNMDPSSSSNAGMNPSTMNMRMGETPSVGDTTNVVDADGNINTFEQGTDEGPRGMVDFSATDEVVIRLFEASDLSTFLHESGHYFLEMTRRVAEQEDAPQELKDDLAKIREWLGAKDGEPFTREQHEKWARGFELYAMEGNAPSTALAEAFSRFRAWLLQIYASAARLNVRLTDDIREVMDRMLATDQEIAEVREAQQLSPLFAERPPGMSEAAYRTYQRQAQRSAREAEERLLKKAMDKVRRQRTKEYKAEYKAELEIATEQLSQAREYVLINTLANGAPMSLDGLEVEGDIRLNRQELIDTFGEDILRELDRRNIGGKRPLWSDKGMSVGEVAELFGFRNPQEMIDQLRGTRKLADAAREQAQARMDERYGDFLTDGSMEEEALAAVHNDQQVTTNVTELRHLTERAGGDTRAITARVYRYRAQEMLSRMRVKEAAKPHVFLAAERTAARKAQEAFAKVQGARDATAALEQARIAKEQQVLNHYLYKESVKIRDMVEKGRERMMKYRKKSIRDKLRVPYKIDDQSGQRITYIDRIDDLLDRFDFRRRTEGQVRHNETLLKFVEDMRAAGREGELAISPEIMEKAERTHYSRLSVSELQGLFDTVANIDHLGRRANEVNTARGKRQLNAVIRELSDLVRTNIGTGRAKQDSTVRTFFNNIFTMDTMLIEIDGGDEMGAAYDYLKYDIDQGMAKEQAMNVQLAEDMEQLFSAFTKKEMMDMHRRREVPGANGRPWSKAEILAVALNMGNADNIKRLMDPNAHELNRLTTQQREALLDTLTKRDWDFVQSTWDYVNSYWDQIVEVEERRTGVRPKKVQAQPVTTKFGVYPGGYYPIKYDPGLTANASIDQQSRWDEFVSAGRFTKAHTADGHLQARKDGANGRTLHLDMAPLFGHMRDVIRGIALSEAVDNAYRIMNTGGGLQNAMINAGRSDDFTKFNLWLDDVARGPVFNTDVVNSIARQIKTNFSLSRLAFNMKTVVLQATGLTQSAVVVGKKELAVAYQQYARNRARAVADVMARSEFMRERATSFQKDIMDFRNETQVRGPVVSQDEAATRNPLQALMQTDAGQRVEAARNWLAQAGFWPMIKMQFLVVDVPTWLAAYNTGLQRFKGDDARAIQYADRLVARSQGSGFMADRSGFERGTLSPNTRQQDVIKVWTALQSYMLAKLNRAYIRGYRGVREMRGADTLFGRAQIASRMAGDMMLLYMGEAAAMMLMYAWLSDDDEPEDYLTFMMKETGAAVFGGVPFVREMWSGTQGFDTGGVIGATLKIPSTLIEQFWEQDGGLDRGGRRAAADAVGTLTGLPSTAALRAINGVLEFDAGYAIMGYNPLEN